MSSTFPQESSKNIEILNSNLEQIIEKIKQFSIDWDFPNVKENIELLNNTHERSHVIELLLVFIENNPGLDFGTPGPIIHFLEKFYKKWYEERLVISVKRKPNFYLIWMLNRVISWSEWKERENFQVILSEIANRDDLEENLKQIIQELSY